MQKQKPKDIYIFPKGIKIPQLQMPATSTNTQKPQNCNPFSSRITYQNKSKNPIKLNKDDNKKASKNHIKSESSGFLKSGSTNFCSSIKNNEKLKFNSLLESKDDKENHVVVKTKKNHNEKLHISFLSRNFGFHKPAKTHRNEMRHGFYNENTICFRNTVVFNNNLNNNLERTRSGNRKFTDKKTTPDNTSGFPSTVISKGVKQNANDENIKNSIKNTVFTIDFTSKNNINNNNLLNKNVPKRTINDIKNECFETMLASTKYQNNILKQANLLQTSLEEKLKKKIHFPRVHNE